MCVWVAVCGAECRFHIRQCLGKSEDKGVSAGGPRVIQDLIEEESTQASIASYRKGSCRSAE